MPSNMRVILGTMTFGYSGDGVRITDAAKVKEVLETFKSFGHDELDTARMYCGGSTEQMLGDLKAPQEFKLATKVYPVQPGDHEPEKLKATFAKSLEALQTKKVDIFYLHAPDHGTPFEKTLRAVQDLYEAGHFTELGLSNFLSWEVTEVYYICKQNGWVLPTVYQGMYNAITRDVEHDLFSCLKKFNIRFYAYNPIAGGAFSPNRKFREEVEAGSRFDPTTTPGKRYRERYWNETFFSAMEHVHSVAEKHNISSVDVALRWMVHHSGMDAAKGDAVIIGASSIDHMTQNLKALQSGPLPEDIVTALDEAWMKAKPVCPVYFR
ncbi:hypothetical protein BZG36_01913 [Bifiguratus adelaidae]|uniref:NADP-dependent oxidoreductase domain-containing protein n=1 Tax=Bifiguratus adelaidae TaxID=1938954 RepID=A0A261Y4W4_9FUNG|nr:hypothetical protein BZG36_01913 [Bifiguratus adelaidae]